MPNNCTTDFPGIAPGLFGAEGRRRKHGTICTDPERHRKDKSKHNCARMAVKSGYPGKRPGNIPADVGGVQVRLERIAEHAKRNYYLGRLSPAYFSCAGASSLVRVRAARFPQAFILRFKTFRSSNGQEYGASCKNVIQGQNTSASGTKNHCTLTIIYIGAML